MSPCRDAASVSSFASVVLIVSAFLFLHLTLFVSVGVHASQEMVSFFRSLLCCPQQSDSHLKPVIAGCVILPLLKSAAVSRSVTEIRLIVRFVVYVTKNKQAKHTVRFTALHAYQSAESSKHSSLALDTK